MASMPTCTIWSQKYDSHIPYFWYVHHQIKWFIYEEQDRKTPHHTPLPGYTSTVGTSREWGWRRRKPAPSQKTKRGRFYATCYARPLRVQPRPAGGRSASTAHPRSIP